MMCAPVEAFHWYIDKKFSTNKESNSDHIYHHVVYNYDIIQFMFFIDVKIYCTLTIPLECN